MNSNHMHFGKLKAILAFYSLSTDDMWQLKGHTSLNFLSTNMSSYYMKKQNAANIKPN